MYSTFKYYVSNRHIIPNLIRVFAGDKSLKALFTFSDRNDLTANFAKILNKNWDLRMDQTQYPTSILITKEFADELKASVVDVYNPKEYKTLCYVIGVIDFIVIDENAKYFDIFNTGNYSYSRFNIKKLLDPSLEKHEIRIKLEN
jgi:hypothetical protein